MSKFKEQSINNRNNKKRDEAYFDNDRGIVLSESIKETFKECNQYLQNKNK